MGLVRSRGDRAREGGADDLHVEGRTRDDRRSPGHGGPRHGHDDRLRGADVVTCLRRERDRNDRVAGPDHIVEREVRLDLGVPAGGLDAIRVEAVDERGRRGVVGADRRIPGVVRQRDHKRPATGNDMALGCGRGDRPGDNGGHGNHVEGGGGNDRVRTRDGGSRYGHGDRLGRADVVAGLRRDCDRDHRVAGPDHVVEAEARLDLGVPARGLDPIRVEPVDQGGRSCVAGADRRIPGVVRECDQEGLATNDDVALGDRREDRPAQGGRRRTSAELLVRADVRLNAVARFAIDVDDHRQVRVGVQVRAVHTPERVRVRQQVEVLAARRHVGEVARVGALARYVVRTAVVIGRQVG